MPSIGIVIPCYNDDAAHLREAVASALAQDVPVQVVVVDDGSTKEETLAELDALPESVTLVRQANAGVSAARNAGIAQLTCDYVQALDADDWLTPGFVRAAAAVLDGGARIASSDVSHNGPGGSFQRIPDAVSLSDMVDTNLIGSASMFRRADWEQVGGYDQTITIGSEDYEFWVRLLALGGEVRRFEGQAFHHRLRDGSLSALMQSRFIASRKETRAAMARNTPAIAGPALDRVDELLREVARLESDNRWWWRRFGWIRRVARVLARREKRPQPTP